MKFLCRAAGLNGFGKQVWETNGMREGCAEVWMEGGEGEWAEVRSRREPGVEGVGDEGSCMRPGRAGRRGDA